MTTVKTTPTLPSLPISVMDDDNDLIGYLLIKGAISGRYKYVLSDAHTKEVLAVDDQPYLLNFLRLGLSDCTMTVLPDNIALDYESTITHLKLMVLKRLMLEIEKAKCDLMLTAPEHLSFTLTDELRKFSKEYYDIDADLLQKEIKFALRTQASPRHVPDLIVVAPELPRTKSNKLVELAVTDVVNGREVRNRDALANPDSLDWFKVLVP